MSADLAKRLTEARELVDALERATDRTTPALVAARAELACAMADYRASLPPSEPPQRRSVPARSEREIRRDRAAASYALARRLVREARGREPYIAMRKLCDAFDMRAKARAIRAGRAP